MQLTFVCWIHLNKIWMYLNWNVLQVFLFCFVCFLGGFLFFVFCSVSFVKLCCCLYIVCTCSFCLWPQDPEGGQRHVVVCGYKQVPDFPFLPNSQPLTVAVACISRHSPDQLCCQTHVRLSSVHSMASCVAALFCIILFYLFCWGRSSLLNFQCCNLTLHDGYRQMVQFCVKCVHLFGVCTSFAKLEKGKEFEVEVSTPRKVFGFFVCLECKIYGKIIKFFSSAFIGRCVWKM